MGRLNAFLFAQTVKSGTVIVFVCSFHAELAKNVSMVRVTALLSAKEGRSGMTMETASP